MYENPPIIDPTGKAQFYTTCLINVPDPNDPKKRGNRYHMEQLFTKLWNTPVRGRRGGATTIPQREVVSHFAKVDLTDDNRNDPEIQKWCKKRFLNYRIEGLAAWSKHEAESLDYIAQLKQTAYLGHLHPTIMKALEDGAQTLPLIMIDEKAKPEGAIVGKTAEGRDVRLARPRTFRFDLHLLRRALNELTVLSDAESGAGLLLLDKGKPKQWKDMVEDENILLEADQVSPMAGQRFWTWVGKAPETTGAPPTLTALVFGRMPDPWGQGGVAFHMRKTYAHWLIDSATYEIFSGHHNDWLASHPTPIEYRDLLPRKRKAENRQEEESSETLPLAA